MEVEQSDTGILSKERCPVGSLALLELWGFLATLLQIGGTIHAGQLVWNNECEPRSHLCNSIRNPPGSCELPGHEDGVQVSPRGSLCPGQTWWGLWGFEPS